MEEPPKLPSTVKIGEENHIAFRTGEWARTHDLKKIAREAGLDENVYDLASWDFLDWTTTMRVYNMLAVTAILIMLSRTWPVVGSLEKARQIGWGKDKDIGTYEDGYVPTFDRLKQYKVFLRATTLVHDDTKYTWPDHSVFPVNGRSGTAVVPNFGNRFREPRILSGDHSNRESTVSV